MREHKWGYHGDIYQNYILKNVWPPGILSGWYRITDFSIGTKRGVSKKCFWDMARQKVSYGFCRTIRMNKVWIYLGISNHREE